VFTLSSPYRNTVGNLNYAKNKSGRYDLEGINQHLETTTRTHTK
jgi:hypothetical protein